MSNHIDESERTTDGAVRRSTAETNESSREDAPDRLDERLRAVERALTGSDVAVADLGDDAAAAAEREALESRVADLDSRVEELEAATEAIRGYVGSIRAVNREVERRADLALARAGRDEHDAVQGENDLDAVPSEDALDAAVPTDSASRAAAPPETDAEGLGAGDDTDESWRDEALDRLRESL